MDETAWDIITDPNDNSIYITGWTQSTVVGDNAQTSPCDAPGDNGFPLCNLGGNSYFQNTSPGSGGFDHNAFLAKFSSQNKLLWSTYFGGYARNQGHHLAINSQGDLYLVGITKTGANVLPDAYCDAPNNGGFPLCDPHNGAYYRDNYNTTTQQNEDKGYDVFITKFNPAKQIIWSTFYGGSGDDYNGIPFWDDNGTVDIDIDENDGVFILGNTIKASGNGDIYTKPHNNFYYQPDNVGTGQTRDAFLAVFNKDCQPLWATNFGGGGNTFHASDIGCGLTVSNNKLYITGGTTSTTFPPRCPNTPNPYCQPTGLAGNYDAFIARFDITYLTSINEVNVADNPFLIYPNPTTGKITLVFDVQDKQIVTINVYNNLGQVVYSRVSDELSGKINYDMDFNEFPSGLYLVQTFVGNNIICSKVIKQY